MPTFPRLNRRTARSRRSDDDAVAKSLLTYELLTMRELQHDALRVSAR
ncbi:hypothetical protein BJ978_002890 [Agromyces terreus]|uniref:Uncharacterized protein n=1 Tax=Agromyces terreus TaxID=424795 RepID=A0A9X2H8Z2_9MICO|nr:hypothetical protein [Agromyces terreus]MCP2372214.1 hypothetical protein [Agromyces terreus]